MIIVQHTVQCSLIQTVSQKGSFVAL